MEEDEGADSDRDDSKGDRRPSFNEQLMEEVLRAKEGNPSQFESVFDITEEEEDEIEAKRINHIPEDASKRLLWAAETNNVNMLEELLDENSSLVNLTDEDGYTALHRACYSGNIDCIEVLMKFGCDVNAKTVDGWQPIHSACRWNNYKCASLLLQNGADINASTHGGQTALHLAACDAEARKTLVLLLLHDNINPSLRNNAGDTAYDIARRTGPVCDLFEMAEESLNFLYEDDTF